MTINLKKTLLAGTAVLAMGGFVVATASPAFAAGELAVDTNDSNDGTFETDRNSPLDFTADRNHDIRVDDNAVLDVDNNENIGDALTSQAGIVFASTGGATLTLIDGNDDDGTITANVVGGVSLADGVSSGILLVSADGNGADDPFVIDVNGSINLGTGILYISADGDSNNTATVNLSSNLTAGSVQFNSAGSVLTLDGSSAQTINAGVVAMSSGAGVVNITNNGNDVTFQSSIGTSTSALGALNIGGGANVNGQAVFERDVNVQTITLGNGGGTRNLNSAVFLASGNSISHRGGITGVEALDVNTVTVKGSNVDSANSGTVTFNSAIGSATLDAIVLVSNARAVFNDTVTTSSGVILDGNSNQATFNGNVTGGIVFSSERSGVAPTSSSVTVGAAVTSIGAVDNISQSSAGSLVLGTGSGATLAIGQVGNTKALGSISMTSSGTLQFGNTVAAHTISFASGTGGTIDFANTVTANTITLGTNDSVFFKNAVTANSGITLGSGSTTRFTGAGNIASSITGSAGADTVVVVKATNIGSAAGNALDLGAGNDTFSVAGGATVTFASGFSGGAGTDTLFQSAGNNTIAADIVNFESVRIKAGQLTLTGDLTGTTTDLVFDATGTLVLNNVSNVSVRAISGSTAADTITVTNGSLEVASGGTIDLKGDADTVSLVSGRIGRTDGTNTLELGAGNDTLNLGAGILYASVSNAGGTDTIETTANGSIMNTVGSNIDIDLNDTDTLTIDLGTSGLARTDFDASVTDGANGAGTLNLRNLTFDGNITLGDNGADVLNVSASTINGSVTDGAGGGTILATFSGGTTTVNHIFDLDAAGSTTTVANGATVRFLSNAAAGNIDLGDTLTLQSSGSAARIALGKDTTVQVGTMGAVTDGIIEFVANGADASGNLDTGQLQFTGAAVNFVSTNRLEVQLSGTVQLGSSVIITGAAANANAVPTITDNFLFDFSLSNDGAGNVKVTVARNNDLGSIGTSATQGAGAAIQPLLSDANAAQEFKDFATLLSTTGRTSAQIENDLESIAPTVDGSATQAVSGAIGNSAGVVSTRLASLRTGSGVSGMAAGDLSQGLKVWGQAFGASGEQDRRGGVDGYDFDTYGMAVGVDTQGIAENLTMGLAFSYANTDADSDNANSTETEVDTYLFTLYGDYNFGEGIYAAGQLGYGWSDIERNRFNVGGVAGRTANGDFDADQILARLEVGRDYMMDNGLIITPNVLANYASVDSDSFTETGAGAFNLTEDTDRNSVFEMGVGVKFSGQIQQPNGDYLKPELSLGYRYDFLEDEVDTTSNFAGGGASFQTEGAKPEQNRFNIGAGLTYLSTTNWEFQAQYNFDTREDYSAHSGYLRAAYKF